MAERPEELGDHEAEGADIVGLHVLVWDPDPRLLEQLLLWRTCHYRYYVFIFVIIYLMLLQMLCSPA